MATATITNTLSNNVDSVAAEVNTNFTDLTTFLNNSVLHRDGAKTPTADLALNNNRVTNVAVSSASTDAVARSEIDTYSQAGVWTRSTTFTGTYATDIEFDAEVADPLGIADLGTDAGLFTIPSDGLYMFVTQSTTNPFYIRVNNNAINPGNSFTPSGSVAESTVYYWCETGDEVVCRVFSSFSVSVDDAKLVILKVAD